MSYIERDEGLPKEVAERVKFLRVGGEVIHSWRRVAEIICEEFPEQPKRDGWESVEDAHGNQLYGIDLCRAAAAALGEDVNVWEDEIEKALSDYREWLQTRKEK